MDILIYLQEYQFFNRWLKKEHPRLYAHYSSHILVPRNDDGVQIMREGLSEKAYRQLLRIRSYYYDTVMH